MRIHYRINLSFTLIIIVILNIISCNNKNPVQKTSKSFISDIAIIHTQSFKNFNFNIHEIIDNSSEPEYHCYIQRQNSNNNYFLFETINQYKNEKLQHLFNYYYAFPYFTGGNYCRATGINIIKVAEDTAFFIGPVSGYDDIDSNGVKELYINVATDLSGAQVNHTIEQFEVLLVNDSLVYQEIDLY